MSRQKITPEQAETITRFLRAFAAGMRNAAAGFVKGFNMEIGSGAKRPRIKAPEGLRRAASAFRADFATRLRKSCPVCRGSGVVHLVSSSCGGAPRKGPPMPCVACTSFLG